MTVPASGDISSSAIAGICMGYPTSTVTIPSTESRWLSGVSSGPISFENFRRKSWRQGTQGGALPTHYDPRLDGYGASGSYTNAPAANQWEARLYQDTKNRVAGAQQANSFFYCSTPGTHYINGTVQVLTCTGGEAEADRRGEFYVWAYTSGYLSGSRVQLYSRTWQFGSNFNLNNAPLNVTAGYPYVVVNLSAWGGGTGASGSGGQTPPIDVKLRFSGGSITPA